LLIVDLCEVTNHNELFLDSFGFEASRKELSPLHRAQGGTLILVHPAALQENDQEKLARALEDRRDVHLIVVESKAAKLIPRLERELAGPRVLLPSLEERPEDLQAFVLAELTRIGITERGTPWGIEKAALYELVQRDFAGNEAELRGLLLAATAEASGDRVTLADVRRVLFGGEVERIEDLEPEVSSPRRRSRMRHAPRARRH
jgi:DNA-binding NtrC family response regulator